MKNKIKRIQVLIVLFIAVAMPLFFSFYRDTQLQQTINQLPALPADSAQHNTDNP